MQYTPFSRTCTCSISNVKSSNRQSDIRLLRQHLLITAKLCITGMVQVYTGVLYKYYLVLSAICVSYIVIILYTPPPPLLSGSRLIHSLPVFTCITL